MHFKCVGIGQYRWHETTRVDLIAAQNRKCDKPPPATATEIRVGGDPNGKPSDPGMVCLECGTELIYNGRGRRPRYCSSSCRHRAWERRRAAADGVIASQVVELPALPMEPTYTRTGVIGWLRDSPRRLADVVAALPETEESARLLNTARSRLRRLGVRTETERRIASRAEQDLARLRWENRAYATVLPWPRNPLEPLRLDRLNRPNRSQGTDRVSCRTHPDEAVG